MKDFNGTEIQKGDIVAVVYHPRAYEFSLEKGAITAMDEKSVAVTLAGTDEAITVTYKISEKGTVNRVAKIAELYPKVGTENDQLDAVGQSIQKNGVVAFQKPNELGNTCKGFELGGTITRTTKEYVFAIGADGKEHRKMKKKAVVIG